MTITAFRQLACSVAIAVALLAFVHDAHAANSTLTFGFPTSDTSGITVQTAPGIGGCVVGCALLRVASRVALPAKRQAVFQFSVPPGTTIVSGTANLRYRTKNPSISVHLRNRLSGRWVEGSRLRSAAATHKSVTFAGGGTGVAISLMADTPVGSRAIHSDAENTVAIDSVVLTVRDLSVPVVSWATGDPGTGLWQRGAICGGFAAQDSGLGIDHVDYGIGQAVATATAAPGTRMQPRPLSFTGTVCVDTTQLADGVYGSSLAAVDTSPDGNRSAALSGLVRVDNSVPSVTFVPPSDAEARQPQLQVQVSDHASGVDTVTLSLDGNPLAVKLNGDMAVATPPVPLVDGVHRVSWTVADVAGNSTQDSATFGVSDATPPTIDQVAPVGLTTTTTPIAAHIVDSGSGLAIEAIHLAVDGSDVTALVDVADGSILYRPAHPWAEGEHSVRLTVGDHSGNRTVRTWTFQLPVVPPPPPPTPTPPPATTPGPADTPNGASGNPGTAASGGDSLVETLSAAVTLQGPTRVLVHGAKTVIHVNAHRGDLPAAGLRLSVTWLSGRHLADAVADDQGEAEIPISVAANDTLVVAAAGVEIKIAVTRGPSLSLATAQRSVRQGGLLQLHGVLRGSEAAQVRLEAKVGRGWRLVVNVPVGRHGSFSTPVRLPAVGTYVVRMRAGTLVSAPLRLVAR